MEDRMQPTYILIHHTYIQTHTHTNARTRELVTTTQTQILRLAPLPTTENTTYALAIESTHYYRQIAHSPT